MTEKTETDLVMEVMVQPMRVDVYAYREDDDILFTHAWKRIGDPKRKKGKIEIPHGESDVPIQFHLHNKTTPRIRLEFMAVAQQAMWVDTVDCPTGAGNGGQITFQQPTPLQLNVTDANTDPPCTLHYALRFDGDPVGDGPPYEYDPEIRNGGGG